MKTRNMVLSLVITVSSMQSFANSGASENSSAASKHSVLAASHGTAASVKVGSAGASNTTYCNRISWASVAKTWH